MLWLQEGEGPLVARRQVAACLRDPFHSLFRHDDFAAAGAIGSDHFLEEAEDEAGGAGEHQDQAHRVEADALDVDVGGEL